MHSVNPFDNIHWGLFIHPGCYEIGSEHGGRLLRTQHCLSSLNKFNTQYGHAKFIQAYLYLKNVFLIISLITISSAPIIVHDTCYVVGYGMGVMGVRTLLKGFSKYKGEQHLLNIIFVVDA